MVVREPSGCLYSRGVVYCIGGLGTAGLIALGFLQDDGEGRIGCGSNNNETHSKPYCDVLNGETVCHAPRSWQTMLIIVMCVIL